MGISDGKIEVRWLDHNQRVLLSTWRPDWTWREFEQRTEDAFTLIRPMTTPVSVIIAVDSGASLPTGSPLPYFKNALESMPPNLEHVILIGATRFLQQIIGIAARLFSHRDHLIRFARNMAEAETMLAISQQEKSI